MSNELRNTFHALGQTWLGVPGWGWLLIVLVAGVVWGAIAIRRGWL